MPVEVACPHCRKKLRAPNKYVGKTVKCPHCQTPFAVQADADGRNALQWHVQTEDNQQYGPVSTTDLGQWVKEGRLDDRCQVLRSDWDQWRWADDVFPELRPAPAGSGPGHPTAGAPGHPATGAPGHPATGAPGHPTAGAPGHPATAAPGHPATAAPGHPATGAPGHPATAAPGVPAALTPTPSPQAVTPTVAGSPAASGPALPATPAVGPAGPAAAPMSPAGQPTVDAGSGIGIQTEGPPGVPVVNTTDTPAPFAVSDTPAVSGPAAGVAYAAKPTGVVGDLRRPLTATAPWVLFLAILGFVFTGLFGLFALLAAAAALFTTFMTLLFGALLYSALGFFGCFMPGFLLAKYHGAIKRYLIDDSEASLHAALKAQHAFWQYFGIFAIVFISLTIILFLSMYFLAGSVFSLFWRVPTI